MSIILFLFSLVSCYNAEVTFNLTIQKYGNGTTQPTGTNEVVVAEPVTITAPPDTNWFFVEWVILDGRGCSIADTYSQNSIVTLTSGDAIILAIFVPDSQAPEGYSVSIDQAYINENNKTSLSFSFNDDETGGTYEYSIDDGNTLTPAVTGSGPVENTTDQITGIDVSALNDSTLMLTFFVTDSAGNIGGNAYATVLKDTIAPSGSFVINNDNTHTLAGDVTLNMTIAEAAEMRFGNTSEELNAASWEPYAESKPWTLPPGSKSPIVYGEFRDIAGNIFEASDTILKIKKVTASDGAALDFFGRSVAVSSDGSTVIVGAEADDDNGSYSGSVYVYDGTNWERETKITASDGAANDYFGSKVAVSSDGSTVIAGAYGDDDNGGFSGSVYVYNSTNWGTETKITASDAAESDYFGSIVAVSSDGSTVIVGVSSDDDNGWSSGSVYVYNSTNWGTETKITASDDTELDYFGQSVAVSSDGSTVIVGAIGDDDNVANSGSVYVYDGTNWGAETKITASDGTEGDSFGSCVAVSSDGSTLIVGAECDDDNGSESGSVYVYDGTNWGTETKITASDGAEGDFFGYSVAVSSDGSTLIVGAYNDDVNGGSSGSVYIIPLE